MALQKANRVGWTSTAGRATAGGNGFARQSPDRINPFQSTVVGSSQGSESAFRRLSGS
jgi:hypothetical protein